MKSINFIAEMKINENVDEDYGINNMCDTPWRRSVYGKSAKVKLCSEFFLRAFLGVFSALFAFAHSFVFQFSCSRRASDACSLVKVRLDDQACVYRVR